MTKTELINMLAAETNAEKRQAKMFLEGLTSIVEKTIKKGGEVPMSGLGKFRVAKRKARMGRNPQTGEPIKIPAKRVVKFRLSKSLKDTVLGKK